jgi:pimeloyl-ACP methyl ester carboxylesterase
VVDSHPGTRAHRRQRRRPGSLLGLVDAVIGEEAFLLVGHSYGGYLARAIANHRPRQAAGLAVLCPIVEPGREDARPEDVVLHAADDLDLDGALEPEMAAEFRGYLVVHTPDTLRRFQETVVPGVALVDQAALRRIFARWELRTARSRVRRTPTRR